MMIRRIIAGHRKIPQRRDSQELRHNLINQWKKGYLFDERLVSDP